jgi:hypothetical protein
MTRLVYQVDVDRVVVDGVAAPLDGGRLRPLVEAAIARALSASALPGGRTMRASVQIESHAIASVGAPAVASAVAAGVAQAVGGSRRG